VSRSRDTKEGRERAEYKRQQEKNIYAKAAVQRSAEQTEELRELRLAQEKRGRARQKVVGARVAKPYTKVLSER